MIVWYCRRREILSAFNQPYLPLCTATAAVMHLRALLLLQRLSFLFRYCFVLFFFLPLLIVSFCSDFTFINLLRLWIMGIPCDAFHRKYFYTRIWYLRYFLLFLFSFVCFVRAPCLGKTERKILPRHLRFTQKSQKIDVYRDAFFNYSSVTFTKRCVHSWERERARESNALPEIAFQRG